jgi:hypothetical protein
MVKTELTVLNAFLVHVIVPIIFFIMGFLVTKEHSVSQYIEDHEG